MYLIISHTGGSDLAEVQWMRDYVSLIIVAASIVDRVKEIKDIFTFTVVAMCKMASVTGFFFAFFTTGITLLSLHHVIEQI